MMSDLTMSGAVGGAEVRRPAVTRPRPDLRSTSHAVTCDYLVGRGHRVCSCSGSRASRPGR